MVKTPDILQAILAHKAKELEDRKAAHPLEEIKQRAA
jgi:hypothetical protein